MYYIAIKVQSGEWRIVKHVSTKEDAVLTLATIRSHNITAAAFITRDGKFKRLVNI